MEDTKDIQYTTNERPILEKIGTYKRNIKVDIQVWKTLSNLKGLNDTFNDVLMGLLKQKTQSIGKENMKLIKYHRKTLFIKTNYEKNIFNGHSIGIEFEYNDVKNQPINFTLDLKMKKVFYGRQILNPSEFFGVDSDHKHLNKIYLNLYLKCVAITLQKEFAVHTAMVFNKEYEDIALWRKIYYDYMLSEESFINDIQEPMRLSEEDTAKGKYLKDIENSISFSKL